MRLPPDRRRAPARTLAFSLILLFSAAHRATAGGYLDSPGEETRFRPFVFLTGGLNLNTCPQAGAYYEFSRSWQAGLEVRSWLPNADAGYDFIPETDLHLRKLWLGAEERESLRNSEYLDVSVGVFPSYRFLPLDQIIQGKTEPRDGPMPQARLSLGKYWMPFRALPVGLDINLAIGHYFANGHPPGYHHVDYVTATLSVLWLP